MAHVSQSNSVMGQKYGKLCCLKNDQLSISITVMKDTYQNLTFYWKWFKWAIFFIALILPLIFFLNIKPVLNLQSFYVNISNNNATNANLHRSEETPKNLDTFKTFVINCSPKLHPFFSSFSLYYLTNFALDMFWEWKNFMYRYENFNSVFRNVRQYHIYYCYALFIFFLTLISYPFFDIVCTLLCLITLTVIHNIPISSYKWSVIQKTQKLDHSRALAEWYFHSYLVHALSQDTDEPFKRRIEVFEETERVTIQAHKLIILMPTSCFVHNNLENSDPRIEYRKNLVDLQSVNAPNRTYSMSVYRVKTKGGKDIHFLAEIATPLKNANDSRVPKFTLSKSEKCELVSNFYLHLKELMEFNLKLANTYILVPYKDQDENGVSVELSRVILNAIDAETELTEIVFD